MMHELSQGADYIRWFEEYPYGYYHADTTPLYILAVSDFVRESGDLDFAREIWPSIRKAYDYCASTDEDGDGLMDNTRAGLGAVETGTLRSTDVLTDVYLAAAWTAATPGRAEMASALGERDCSPRGAARRTSRARASLNGRFLDDADPGDRLRAAEERNSAAGSRRPGRHSVSGAVVFDSGRPAVAAALDALGGSGLGADWGARMLSNESALYDPRATTTAPSGRFSAASRRSRSTRTSARMRPGSTSRARSRSRFSRRAATFPSSCPAIV